jgi:hypothetical protein
MPAAVKVKNKAGADAAVRYFLDTYTYGFATGDAQPFRGMSTDECQFCLGIIDKLYALSSDGERYEGGGQKVVALDSRAHDAAADSYLARVVFDEMPTRLVDSSGKTAAPVSGDKGVALDLKVLWVDDHWRIDKGKVARS